MSPGPTAKQPALFISHGEPAFTMDAEDATNRWLRRFGPSLRATNPRAVLCISAHHVASRLCVGAADPQPTLHDHASTSLSSFTYPAPGSRTMARRVIEQLLRAGLDATLDDKRGLDHGAWMPLSIMFPEHDLPVVPLSLHAAGDPELHLAIGRAIAPLRDDGVLIVGSGGVTHHLAATEKAVPAGDRQVLPEPARRFDAWVTELVTRAAPYARSRGLAQFRRHELSRIVLPSDEHFLPLLVVAGAASVAKNPDNLGELVHTGAQNGLSMSAYLFTR